MKKIILNGNPKEASNINHLSDLVHQVCPNPKHIISEVNGTIIPASAWGVTSIQDGDIIELVTFVGGG